MNTNNPFHELIVLVAKVTPLTPDEYPILEQLSGNPKETFIIGHSVRHLTGTVGDMSNIVENTEHSIEKLDTENMKNKVFSAGFTLCKLCEVLNISADDLVEGIKRKFKKWKTAVSLLEELKIDN